MREPAKGYLRAFGIRTALLLSFFGETMDLEGRNTSLEPASRLDCLVDDLIESILVAQVEAPTGDYEYRLGYLVESDLTGIPVSDDCSG